MKPDASSEQHSAVVSPTVVTLHGRTFELFIDRSAITAAIERMAAAIERDYAGQQLVLVVVLKGALLFAADLARAIKLPLRFEFVRASSYGAAMHSSGTVALNGSLDSVRGRHVLIVEDIADSGTTISAIVAAVEQHTPQSIAVATLLSKPAVHGSRIPLHYVGIEIEPVFVVGYGLDYDEEGRNLPDIYRLVE
jgi:hypoxanthine phosphoribosyltransferase